MTSKDFHQIQPPYANLYANVVAFLSFFILWYLSVTVLTDNSLVVSNWQDVRIPCALIGNREADTDTSVGDTEADSA